MAAGTKSRSRMSSPPRIVTRRGYKAGATSCGAEGRVTRRFGIDRLETDSCVVVTTGQPHASAAARPGRPEPIGHVQGGEDAERLDRRNELGAMGFEAVERLAVKRLVILVDEHLAPILDHDVT